MYVNTHRGNTPTPSQNHDFSRKDIYIDGNTTVCVALCGSDHYVAGQACCRLSYTCCWKMAVINFRCTGTGLLEADLRSLCRCTGMYWVIYVPFPPFGPLVCIESFMYWSDQGPGPASRTVPEISPVLLTFVEDHSVKTLCRLVVSHGSLGILPWFPCLGLAAQELERRCVAFSCETESDVVHGIMMRTRLIDR